MTITYVDNLGAIVPEQLKGFFAGWPSPPSLHGHLEILTSSYKVWLALDGNQCIGFINAISDGHFCAFIPLLEVLPAYQGKGVGSELVRRMLASLDDHYSIDIVCDADVAGFYDSLGFTRLVGMARRNYANQGARSQQANASGDPDVLQRPTRRRTTT